MTAYNRPAVTVDLKNVIGPAFYESHRAIREQRAHTPVSYTHLDVYKRQGGDIRKAMDVLTNAAYNGDVSFSGLLTAAASTPGVNI